MQQSSLGGKIQVFTTAEESHVNAKLDRHQHGSGHTIRQINTLSSTNPENNSLFAQLTSLCLYI
jgi:hypothetical protein